MKLQPGDILLYRENKYSPIHDKLIALGEWLLNKQFTKSSYYHVAMVDLDTDLILEAVWPKTHVVELVMQPNIEVYRIKDIKKSQVNQAILWAHENLGIWYSVGQLLFGLFSSKHKVICSTYVGEAFKSADINLGDITEKIFSPDEIAISPLLERIR
jgi:hypothetical protein